jgi:hypothetical protein
MTNANLAALLAVTLSAPAFVQEKPAPADDTVKIVPTRSLGVSIETLQFVDATATPEGKRIAFDPIPAGTAFEVWMEGMPPRKVYVTEPVPGKPDETQQVQKPFVSVLRVADAEWDDFVAFMLQGVEACDLATFKTAVLNTMLDQKGTLLYHRDALPSVAQRAAPALEKLARGTPFRQVSRVYSEDQTSGPADGLIDEDTRGGMLAHYPFSKVVFELNTGEVVGPIFNKDAAYLLRVERFTASSSPRFDRARVCGIVIRYTTGMPLSGRVTGEIQASLRIRTDEERFKLLVPPGIRVPPPTTFGPDDIAPIGNPDMPLKRLGDEIP